MTMQVKAVLLLSVLPLAAAHLGARINTSIWATSSSYGGYYCPGPFPGGYLGDPNISHPFYYGVDCEIIGGQPMTNWAALFGGFLFTGVFIYLLTVVRKEVGYSSFLRDISAYSFWLAMSWYFGFGMHYMAYVGSQYENVSDVPEWVYSLGLGSWFIEHIAGNADGVLKVVIGLRLLFEPCCTCSSTQYKEYLWGIMHAFVFFYIIPTDIYGHYANGTYIHPFGEYEYFNFFAEQLVFLYGILRCNWIAVLSAVVSLSQYYPWMPFALLNWQYFDGGSYEHIVMISGMFIFFLAMPKVLRNNYSKLQTESKTEPLLM